MLYRRDTGTMLGLPFRSSYFDTRLDLASGGNLLGPRLGNYQLTGGVDFLRQGGEVGSRDDARSRLGGRVNLFPLSRVTLNSFYDGGWTNATPATVQYQRSDAWGAGVGTRLLPSSTTSADFERREDHYSTALNSARTARAHHGSSYQFGPHGVNLAYDLTDRRITSGVSALDYRTRRDTGRLDTHVLAGWLGTFGGWFQADFERSRTASGTLPDHSLANLAANVDLDTRLAARTSMRNSYADQSFRYETDGAITSLRFQIAESRLEGRRSAATNLDLHGLVRAQFSHVERQPDLLLATALTDLEQPRPSALAVIPRGGANFYSGGIDDGNHFGEILGLTARARLRVTTLEFGASRERTKSTGLRGQSNGGYTGYSPRQAGTQLVHTARAAISSGAGRGALGADYEFQRVENSSLDLDYDLQLIHASASYHVNDRLTLDAGAEYSTTDNSGIYFTTDYRSVSGTLAMTARPMRAMDLRLMGTYGRVPAGARETYWLSENTLAYHFPQLELALLYRAEQRAPETGMVESGRTERLLELRLTRSFFGAY
jgi:hypothetical protein